MVGADDRVYRLGAFGCHRHRIEENFHAGVLLAVLSITLFSVSPGLAAAGSSPLAIDACALLKQDEVSAAVGKRVETG